MKKNLVWLIVLAFVNLNLAAQEWKWFNAGNTILPSNNITSLAINDSGKLYAGTLSGLAAYYNNVWQKVNLGNMTSTQIRRVWTDSASLWIGTEYNGLWGYTNNAWKNYDPSTSGNGIVGFGIDSRDSIYRLDKFGDFDLWASNDWSQILNFFSQPNNLFIDRSDNVWLMSNNVGMKQYKNGKTIDWGSYYNPTDPKILPSGSIFDMVQDKTGLYWIASNDGLIKFNGTTFQLINTQNSNIGSNKLRCLAFDRKGRLWVGTWDAGVTVLDGTSWKTYNSTNSPLTSPIINDIAIDTSDRIWIANGYNEFTSPSQGQGIFVLDESVDLSNGRLPAAPGGLTGKVISVNEVNLSWNDLSDNETGFLLERSTGNNTNFQQLKFLSPNTVSFTDLTVAGNTTYYYRIRATNSQGSSQYSNVIQVQPKYCTVNKTDYSAYAIARKVIFGNINNQPFNCRNGYYDYLDQSTQLFKGQTLVLTLGIDRCSITSDPIIGASVYIDWNGDGDFSDTNELVFTKTNIDGKEEFYIPVTVPDNVIPGTTTRMRVRSEDDVYSNTVAVPPCGYAEETQDYTLYIIDAAVNNKPHPVITTNITSRAQQVQWQDNAFGETGYFVERSADSISFNRIAILPPNTISFKDSLLQPDTRYYYRVYVKTINDSTVSDILGSTTLSADFTRQWQGDITRDRGFNVGPFWDDFNNDGKSDVYVSGNNLLFINDGTVLNNSQFNFINSSTAAWGDFDNDGDDDLYVTDYLYGGGGAPPVLYENMGNGTFSSLTSFALDGRINNAVWTDYNNDGFLDMYISYIDLGYGKLYRNNKNKTFSFARKFDNAAGYASFADYDNDGDDDLVVMGAGQTAVFNRQDSSFTRNQTSVLALYSENCRGVSWADFDNDGDQDLFVPNSFDNVISSLYVNSGSGNFIKNNSLLQMVNGAAYGSAWADYDNDGLQDLFVSRFNKTNKLLRNKQVRFEDIPGSVYLDENFTSFPYNEMPSLGCAWADYNNDGFLDMYVAVSGGFQSRLYKNGTNQYNWIEINLKGIISNANAIGAMVKINVNGQWQYRWVQSGSGYSGHNSFTVEFGLKNASVIDSIIVHWPSGIEQVLTNVNKNQVLTITEKSTPTSTNDPQYTEANIYPNPASDKIYIVLQRDQFIRTPFANIYDVNGKTSQRRLKHTGGTTYSVNLDGLLPGIYWLEIKEKKVLVRKKILVVR